MTPHYKELAPGFSTADTRVSPTLTCKSRLLELSFTDYAGIARTVQFEGALAFRWSEEDEDSASSVVPYDRVYEVEGSPWRAQFLKARSASQPPRLRHFKLCFNAMGECLDVLAEAMMKKEPNQPPEPTRPSGPSGSS